MRVCGYLSIVLAVIGFGEGAIAQIQPDKTLGAEGSIFNGNAIEGGAIRGTNLLHSFQDFNINTNQRIDFANPSGITDIFSRITGPNPSHILGTLGVLGNANLTLLNPNGILFGPNAQLDIRGSFTATTAHSTVFDNGYTFSAVNPDAPPLLNIGVPLGLQYGTNPGSIENFARLEVGGNLHLAGGNMTLQNQLLAGGDLTLEAQETVEIRDSVTQPFIAAAQGALTVQGNKQVDIFALNHPDSGLVSGGDMVLRSANPAIGDAHYWSGGDFRIEDLASNLGDLYSPFDPIIIAAGDVSFASYTGASLHLFAGGGVTVSNRITINGIDVIADTINPISTPSLANFTLSDGTPIEINGNARPTIDIRAGMNVGSPTIIETSPPVGSISSLPNLFSVPTTADILIANISMAAPDGMVYISNTFEKNTSLSGGNILIGAINNESLIGNANDVVIDARNDLSVFGSIQASSRSTNGSSGSITLLAENTFKTAANTASISSVNQNGVSGNITIKATEILIESGGSITNASLGTSEAGEIRLESERIRVVDGSLISGDTSGSGNGASIILSASESIDITGNGTSINVQTDDIGNAGTLTITTPRLLIRNSAKITGRTGGQGRGGNIQINAQDFGMHWFPDIQIETLGEGIGGSLIINSEDFRLNDGSKITGISYVGTGPGGSVDINATRFFQMDNGSQINMSTSSENLGGSIYIDTPRFEMTRSTLIESITTGSGQGGDVRIDADEMLMSKGFIQMFVTGDGNAGTLTISGDIFQLQNLSSIATVTGGAGRGGNILFNLNDTFEMIGSDGARNPGGIFPSTQGPGNAGGFTVNTRDFIMRDGVFIYSSANNGTSGNAGNITINASGFTSLLGTTPQRRFPTTIQSDAQGSGNGGSIGINTQSLLLQNGSRISTSANSSGNAGTVDIWSRNSVTLHSPESDIISYISIDSDSTGNAGQLKIRTRRMTMEDGAQVFADTTGQGRAGNLLAEISEELRISGMNSTGEFNSRLFFDSVSAGDAGELRVFTPKLILENGGQISAATSGSGRGGLIDIDASDSVNIRGRSPDGRFSSGLFFDSRGAGDARGITVNTGRLDVREGGTVTVSGSGTGRSGNLEINAQSVDLWNQGSLRATTAASEGGNVHLNVRENIWVRHNSEITAEAFGTSNGGNLKFNVGGAILARLEENSDIVANAEQGRGGTITGSALFVGNFRQFADRRTSESDFIASSASGIDGVVDVTAEEFEPDAELPAQPLEPEIANTCQDQRLADADEVEGRSEFFVTGEGGVSPSPEQVLNHRTVELPFLELEELDRGEDDQVLTQPTVMPDVNEESDGSDAESETIIGLTTPCQR